MVERGLKIGGLWEEETEDGDDYSHFKDGWVISDNVQSRFAKVLNGSDNAGAKWTGDTGRWISIVGITEGAGVGGVGVREAGANRIGVDRVEVIKELERGGLGGGIGMSACSWSTLLSESPELPSSLSKSYFLLDLF